MTQIETRFDQAEIVEVVEAIEGLAAEQQAGFLLSLLDVTPLEQELLIFWHAAARDIERDWQRKIAESLHSLFG